MKFVGYTHELAYRRTDHNVWVNVRFPSARQPTVVRAMLDTGAAITVLNRKWAHHLGIEDVTDANDDIELQIATKSMVKGYIHPVAAEFLGHPMIIDVAFVPSHDTADLLGMRGFFDQLQVGFDHSNRRVHIAFNR